MTSRKTTIPPLLQPYLSQLPESSLLLLTGVLNASTHWLSVRVLRGALGDTSSQRRNRPQEEERKSAGREDGINAEGKEEQDTAVVLVSWQRDFEFWKTEARRGAGLDLARLAQEDRFAFVDGLTHLLSPPTPTPTSAPAAPTNLPSRHSAVPSRTHRATPTRRPEPASATQPPPPPQQQSSPSAKPTPQPQPQPQNHHTLTSPHLPHALETITHAIRTLTTTNPNRRILLLLDAPSTPLALTPTPASTPLLRLILSLRTLVTSTVVALETDSPFLQPAVHALAQSVLDTTESLGGVRVQCPLETEMSRLVVGLGHQARWVVGVRGLDTGVARDVSGVVRCSRGGAWDDDDDDDQEDEEERTNKTAEKEVEVLYFVQGDGRVNVFERGGGEIG